VSAEAGAAATGGRGAVTLSYPEALAAIQERGRFGIRLGLGRTRALLRELGNPEAGLRGALVGGTNGKGSVLALAASALREAGYRVGQTPKPHLVTYRERICVDDAPIDPESFGRLVGEVAPRADRVAGRHGPPTEFELLTAMVFAWFAEQRIDVALVEVGLGGRLDATHAWDGGVAAITNVALDHTEHLGPTVEAIAREKAAIIMRGDLAVTGAQGDALAVIRRRARRLGVPLAEVAPAPLIGWDRDSITVDLVGLGPTRVGLRGRHQAANAAVANQVLDALEAAGTASVSPDARRRGYAAARWPGRLELIGRDGVEVLLDGAHNPAGAAALATALDDLAPHLASGVPGRPPLTVVTALLSDKDVDGIIEALLPADGMEGARVLVTELPEARAVGVESLAASWVAAAMRMNRTIRVETRPTPDAALDEALRSAPGTVLVTGSLHLVGAARARLVDDPDLVDPGDT
jgi:dihydrofolate synthase/folylpolyglutamate synthase